MGGSKVIFLKRAILIGTTAVMLSTVGVVGLAPAGASPPNSMSGRAMVYGERSSFFSSCWRLQSPKRTTAILQVKRRGVWRTVDRGERRKAAKQCGKKFPYRFRFSLRVNDFPKHVNGKGLGYLTFRIRVADPKGTSTDSVWSQQTYASQEDYDAALRETLCKVLGLC